MTDRATGAISLESLRDCIKKLEGLPPPAMFASDPMLPRDHAVKFTRDGRDYCGAHPDFWKTIPASERGRYQSVFAIEIIDLTLPTNRHHRIAFYDALTLCMESSPNSEVHHG